MKNFQEWKEEQLEYVAPTASVTEPTNVYEAPISAKLQRRLDWLLEELAVQSANLTLQKRGAILERIVQGLGYKNLQQAVTALMKINKNINTNRNMQMTQQQPQQAPQQVQP